MVYILLLIMYILSTNVQNHTIYSVPKIFIRSGALPAFSIQISV